MWRCVLLWARQLGEILHIFRRRFSKGKYLFADVGGGDGQSCEARGLHGLREAAHSGAAVAEQQLRAAAASDCDAVKVRRRRACPAVVLPRVAACL